MTQRTDKERELEEKIKALEEMLELEKIHRQRLDESQREAQRLRHDIKHHLQHIQYLLSLGKVMEASIYINALQGKERYFPKGVFSGNYVVDSVLGFSLYQAQRAGVTITHSIMVPPVLPIDDIDLCILFGNLAQNALEACSRMLDTKDEKNINIVVKIKKGYLFINFTNTFDGRVHKTSEGYETIKLNKASYGIGLPNIKRIVDKYEGALEVSHEDKIFRVSAMLSVRKMVK